MEQQVMYKFGKMELTQFALFEENYRHDVSDVQFQTEVQFSFDKAQNVLCSKIVINAVQAEKPLIKAELKSFFAIKPESVEMLMSDGKILFAPALLTQFASLCYGSMRGVVYAKSMGTQLCSLILPPVYFGSLITSGFTVEK
ncbi:MAG: hypothetical protein K2O30_08050 [Duncaniella sp.]|nr:hypothetical protein [Duncaniella sp.]MDE7146083.1 hypothetical protein [Duncaniella sp.]